MICKLAISVFQARLVSALGVRSRQTLDNSSNGFDFTTSRDLLRLNANACKTEDIGSCCHSVIVH